MMRISNFFLASLLTSILKVEGSVLKVETSFGLQYAATLYKDNYFGCTIQTTPASSQDSFYMFGHHFVSETITRMPKDLNFADKKQAIEFNIALGQNLFFSDYGESSRGRGGSQRNGRRKC